MTQRGPWIRSWTERYKKPSRLMQSAPAAVYSCSGLLCLAIFAIVARLQPVTFSVALARWRGANAKRADGRYAADLLLATNCRLAGPAAIAITLRSSAS